MSKITRSFNGDCERSRYIYDGKLKEKDGWKQWDTSQDAWYFGVWVNPKTLKIFTYAEGDETLEECESKEEFNAKMKEMVGYYGDPPPAFVSYGGDFEGGTVTRTEHFDPRVVEVENE